MPEIARACLAGMQEWQISYTLAGGLPAEGKGRWALAEGLRLPREKFDKISAGANHAEIYCGGVKRKEFLPHDGYGTGERHNDSRSGRRQIGLKPGYLRHTRRRYQPFVPVNFAPGALAARAAPGGVSPEGNSGPYAP